MSIEEFDARAAILENKLDITEQEVASFLNKGVEDEERHYLQRL
jgi:hypothetical protein